MKLAVIPNMTRENAFDVCRALLLKLSSLECEVLMESEKEKYFGDEFKVRYLDCDTILKMCDIVVSVGGDGTFINAAKRAAEHKKPVLCVNAGKLAFLAALEADELDLLKEAVKGNFIKERRMLLLANIIDKNGNTVYSSHCVNDAVVSRSGTIRLMKLSLSCDGAPLITYSADGVIVATPTGSTAYTLSAGGPIVEPGIESIMITPVCAHSFFARSIVLKESSFLEIRHDNSGEAILSCDGQGAVPIPEGAVVTVRRSEAYAEFIKLKPDRFIEILNKKISV